MRVNRARHRSVVWHPIGAGGVYRHAVGDRRPPRGVGAGVEFGDKVHCRETPVAGRAYPRDDPGGMALGRRHDRLAARIDHAYRPIEPPGGDRDEGLDRQIELCAEAAADCGRDDAHLLRRDAQDFCDVVPIHIGRLRAGLNFDAVADAACEARLGLDVGVLDEARLESAFDDDIGGRERRHRVAARDAPAGQDVARAAPVNTFGALLKRLVDRRQGGTRAPRHRKVREIEVTHRLAVANHKRHRLAAKARESLREHGLIGEKGDHSVAVRARHIRGREDGDDPGMSAFERPNVAENKCGVRVRRAHHARGQGLCRPFVGAEDFCAGELADAIEAGNATPDRGLRRQFRDISGIEQARVLHSVEDRAIARAAAQYACERVLDRLFVGTRLSPQESDGGEQNARGADAALRGAMGVKGGAKLRDNDLAVA